MIPPTYQTFGIELELIIFYTTRDQPVSAKDNARYGPVLSAPKFIMPPAGLLETEDGVSYLEAAWVRYQVVDVITRAGFKARAWKDPGEIESSSHDVWNVVPDGSLKLPHDFDRAYSPLKHVGVEIISPALVASAAAFIEIEAVVEAVNAAFRTAVPPCCGFHVHVGRGGKPLELRPVQRTAALLWLAENLLNTLHPACRLGNDHCLGLRRSSNFCSETGAENAAQYLEGLKEGQHVEFSWDRVNKNREKPTYFWHSRPVGLLDATPSRAIAEAYELRLRQPEDERLTKLQLIEGVRQILRANDPGIVAELVSPGGLRGAYNFTNLVTTPSGLNEDPQDLERTRAKAKKPTIEFRQAAGSLDADWIVVWAKICLALSGPAVTECSNDDFFQLLYDCAKSEERRCKYNVFDLLHDIGLDEGDIEFVQLRLMSNRHEREPVLAFHRPDDCPNGILDEGIGNKWYLTVWEQDDWDPTEENDAWEQLVVENGDGDRFIEEDDGWEPTLRHILNTKRDDAFSESGEDDAWSLSADGDAWVQYDTCLKASW
ncbi:hypothetical protein F5Y12DRAFT_791960 [Xylaria sp. FL1777]|nr:hypothetical protein F5Y12DRAFT_791960 [Xylaria sp. FL1777]